MSRSPTRHKFLVIVDGPRGSLMCEEMKAAAKKTEQPALMFSILNITSSVTLYQPQIPRGTISKSSDEYAFVMSEKMGKKSLTCNVSENINEPLASAFLLPFGSCHFLAL